MLLIRHRPQIPGTAKLGCWAQKIGLRTWTLTPKCTGGQIHYFHSKTKDFSPSQSAIRNKKPPACAGGSSLHGWDNLPIEQQQQ